MPAAHELWYDRYTKSNFIIYFITKKQISIFFFASEHGERMEKRDDRDANICNINESLQLRYWQFGRAEQQRLLAFIVR